MAAIPDDAAAAARDGRQGEEGHACGDPRRRRARAPGRRCSATCARSTRCSSCSTASPARASPADDLETLKLELLVADRDHVERRLERVAKQAKSGDATLKQEAEELERAARAPRRRQDARRLAGRAAARARAADDEAAARDRERAGRRSTCSSRRSSPSCPTRRPPSSARASPRSSEIVAAPVRGARPDHVLHRRREGDARVDAAPRRDRARRRGDDPHRHRARLHPLRGDPLGRSRRGGLAHRGGAAGQAAARGQDVPRRGRRRPQRALQRLSPSR